MDGDVDGRLHLKRLASGGEAAATTDSVGGISEDHDAAVQAAKGITIADDGMVQAM